MAKFRNRTIIDASQFIPTARPWPQGVEAFSETGDLDAFKYYLKRYDIRVEIFPGDWLVKEAGLKYPYPCKPDIFEATYEKVGGGITMHINEIASRIADELFRTGSGDEGDHLKIYKGDQYLAGWAKGPATDVIRNILEETNWRGRWISKKK